MSCSKIGTVVLAALLAACSAAEQRSPLEGAFFNEGDGDDVVARSPNRFDSESGGYGFQVSADGGVTTTGEIGTLKAAPVAAPVADPASAERMLVYSGQVRVEVSKPDDVMASFRAQVATWGGHLQRQVDFTVTVRVPASRFEEAFQWVRTAGRVLGESRQTGDVTEEFVDLGIRLDNAKKSRDRLLEVLQRADKVEDVLKVEAELRRLTEEIERMEGRRKFLADQVALSTLEATFQPLTEAPVAKRMRRPSRFAWINAIGAERMMEDF